MTFSQYKFKLWLKPITIIIYEYFLQRQHKIIKTTFFLIFIEVEIIKISNIITVSQR